VEHVLAWAAWWFGLFWLWLLLVGEWNREQIVAAAIAAALAGGVAEFARARTGFAVRLPLRVLADVPQALGMVVVDFGILAWALLASVARGRIVRGELVTRALPPERVWTILVATLSPNAFVVDVDADERVVLLHDLVPNRSSEKPV
jgi:multisubunit Na+/H+ antiporter MnhE subunit